MKAVLATIALLAACKERGTIELSFELPSCGPAPATTLLYAEPNVSCECTCGSCFGAKPDGVNACDGFCGPELDNVSLDLQPGHWAVVLALLDEAGREFASGCTEIDVDEDGVDSSTMAVITVECETCEP